MNTNTMLKEALSGVIVQQKKISSNVKVNKNEPKVKKTIRIIRKMV